MNRRAFMLGGLCAAAGGLRAAEQAPGVSPAGEVSGDTSPLPTNEPALNVRFLGTGSACWEREPRTSKIFRRYSSILVDRRFLIDYTRMAEDMLPEGVRPKALLYTHSHGDHYDPAAAVKLGVGHVFLHRGWLEDARKDFEKAVAREGGAMPVLHPLDVGVKFRLGMYEILPLPGNHWTGKPHEQALIYKVTKKCAGGTVRLLYATDTSGLMSYVFFHGCTPEEPISAVIMEATGQPGRKFDGLRISHSTADMVNEIFTTYLKPGKGRYMPPPGQPVYLTHIGYYEWGQKTFDDILPPGLCVSYDGLEVVFFPPPIVKSSFSPRPRRPAL